MSRSQDLLVPEEIIEEEEEVKVQVLTMVYGLDVQPQEVL